MSAERLRAVVIGARCRRQGIGHHLARFLHAEGVEIAAVCGTTTASAAEAADALRAVIGRRPRTFTPDAAGSVLAQERPDLAVIASPDETHANYLAACLRHDLHVLCEKPMCWGGPDPVAQARDLGRRFLERGRHLVVNAQWPFTLPTWRSLFPGVDPARARRFRMRMSPASRGAVMMPAALPHPLSLLLAVSPPGPSAVEAPTLTWDGDAALRVGFDFIHTEGRIACEVEIVSVPQQPRPAGYGFDDAYAIREVEPATYGMTFHDGQRTVPLPDPTPLLVRSFVDRVRGAPPAALDPSCDPGMAHLMALAAPGNAIAGTDTP